MMQTVIEHSTLGTTTLEATGYGSRWMIVYLLDMSIIRVSKFFAYQLTCDYMLSDEREDGMAKV